jgi:hypothetical protein
MPQQASDWRSTRLGRDAFLHSSVPKGWWQEYADMARKEYDPGVLMARASLMACTWTETTQMLAPIGIDRWPYELSLKYGMRDALTCSVGRRWIVAYLVKTQPDQEPDPTFPDRFFLQRQASRRCGWSNSSSTMTRGVSPPASMQS